MMANLANRAKFSSYWSHYDLEAFNISIKRTDLTTFFGVQELPQSPFENTVLLDESQVDERGFSEDEVGFFVYLAMAEDYLAVDPAVGDFAAFLLRFFGFSSRDLFIRQRPMLRFEIPGKRFDAIVDVALVDRYNYFLLLVQDRVGIKYFSFFILTDI